MIDKILEALNAQPVYRTVASDVMVINRSALSRLRNSNHEAQCWGLLSALRTSAPDVFLWANSDHGATQIVGQPKQTLGQQSIWKLPADLDFDRLLGDESDLGWVLLYFSDLVDEVPKVPEVFPTEGVSLAQTAQDIKAKHLVLSWYDDTEWLVVRHHSSS